MIINRNEHPDVPESGEAELHEHIEVWITAVGRSGNLLHIPPDLDENEPLCKYSHRSDATWTATPVEAFPVGFRDVCGYCYSKFRRQQEQGIR